MGFEPATTLNLTVKQSSYELGYWGSDENVQLFYHVVWIHVSAQYMQYKLLLFEISKVDKNVNPIWFLWTASDNTPPSSCKRQPSGLRPLGCLLQLSGVVLSDAVLRNHIGLLQCCVN